MADNVTADPGSGGAVFATDDVGGTHYPIGKIAFGALDSVTLASADSGAADGGTQRVTVATDDDLMLGTDFSVVFGAATLVTTTQADALANTLDSINVSGFTYVFNGTTWDRVREGGTAGSILVDGSDVTQPISAASLPLPAGAATAANQLANGHDVTVDNAAGASAVNIQDGGNVITVDGTVNAAQSGTWNITDISGTVSLPTGAATSAAQLAADHLVDLQSEHTRNAAFVESIAIGGELDDTAPVAATEGNVSPARITAQRAIHSNLRNNAGSEVGTVSNPLAVTDDGNAILVDGSAVTQPVSGTVTVTHPALGNGTAAGSQRVTIASDTTGVLSVDDNAGSLTVDAAATASNVGAALMTNVIHNGTTALTPKYAIIDAATSGDNTLVAAVAAKKIRVLALSLVSAGTVNARLESGAAGTALSGQMNLVANSGFTLPFNPVGWCETAANTLLNLELSAAISVDGLLVYVEV
jgi:hypothetical protein